MKIHILSDLHVEFGQFIPTVMDADVVVLAGDIHNYYNGILWARGRWPHQTLVYVPGNHEFYYRDRLGALEDMRKAAKDMEIHFLENNEVIIDGVRFLGACLWTDLRLFGDAAMATEMAKNSLTDFQVIYEGEERFRPIHSVRAHQESKAWLKKKLIEEPFDGRTVVVSHHAPSKQSVAAQYIAHPITPCFASNLDELLGYSEVWIHGHTHTSFSYIIKGTRVICNPRGYLRPTGNYENLEFDPGLVLEI